MAPRLPSLIEQVLIDRAAEKMAEFAAHPERLKSELRAPVSFGRSKCRGCGAPVKPGSAKRRCDKCRASEKT